MRKHLVFVGLVLCSTPSLVGAQQMFIEWDDCQSGIVNKDNACNTSAGEQRMMSSFIAPADLSCMRSATFEVIVTVASSTLPLWWQVQTGGCRSGAVFSDEAVSFSSGCNNPFDGGTLTASTSTEVDYGGNPNRLRVEGELTRTDCAPFMAQGSRNSGNAITVRNTKTTGAGGCPGCSTPACIELIRQTVEQGPGDPPAERFDIVPTPTSPAPFVTWQGGGGVCEGMTPSQKTAWGKLKALYR